MNEDNKNRTIPSSSDMPPSDKRPVSEVSARHTDPHAVPGDVSSAKQGAARGAAPQNLENSTARSAAGDAPRFAPSQNTPAAGAGRSVGSVTAQGAGGESSRPVPQRSAPSTADPSRAQNKRPLAAGEGDPSAGSGQPRPPRRQSSDGAAPKSRSVNSAAAKNGDTVEIRPTPSTRVIPTARDQDAVDATKQSAAVTSPQRKKDESMGELLREEGSNAVISLVKAAIYLVVVLVISAIISMSVILIGNDMFAFVKEEREVEIVVPVGADIDTLKNILADAGLIKYPSIFKFYADHKTKDNQNFATLEFVSEDYELPEGKSAAFIAGTYTLNTNMDYEDLLWSFLPPAKSGTSWVTIPEGFTTDEIIDLLVEKGIGERNKYIEVINTYDFSSFWFVRELEEKGIWSVEEYERTGKVSSGRIYRLDGYLFPDTYEFYNASREETVIQKMLYRFSQIFNSEYREMAEAQGFSIDGLITLSSMIEKEAGQPNDFFDVSEVFRNRLAAPEQFPYMQSDATVLYQIHHESGERPTHVTHEDTLLEVPYNTYTNTGLPPGPISNPSATAILAALNPSKKGFYYFVSGPEQTYFSTNQWDHNYWVGVTSQQWAEVGS